MLGWDVRTPRAPVLSIQNDSRSSRFNGFAGGQSKAIVSIRFQTLYKVVAGRYNGELASVSLVHSPG
jgi:hypothetical protein